MFDTNWMKLRLKKLAQIRKELIDRGFASEIVDVHDGVEEFLVKEIKGKIYVCNIHHTFVSWYFTERTSKYTLPMYEDHFFKTIREKKDSQPEPKAPNIGVQTCGNCFYGKARPDDSWLCIKYNVHHHRTHNCKEWKYYK